VILSDTQETIRDAIRDFAQERIRLRSVMFEQRLSGNHR